MDLESVAQSVSPYSPKELEVLEALNDAIRKTGILLEINPAQPFIQSPAAIDVEHDEMGGFVGFGIFDGTHAYYWTAINAEINHLMSATNFVAHNGKTDFELLRQWGIPIEDSQLVWDTFLMAHIIDSSRRDYGLKNLAEKDLGIQYPSYENIVGKRSNRSRVTLDKQPLELVSKYNILDCYATYKLYEYQRKNIY